MVRLVETGLLIYSVTPNPSVHSEHRTWTVSIPINNPQSTINNDKIKETDVKNEKTFSVFDFELQWDCIRFSKPGEDTRLDGWKRLQRAALPL